MSQQEIQEEPHIELFKENIEPYESSEGKYTFSLQQCSICKSTDFSLFVDSDNGGWTIHCSRFAEEDHEKLDDPILRIR